MRHRSIYNLRALVGQEPGATKPVLHMKVRAAPASFAAHPTRCVPPASALRNPNPADRSDAALAHRRTRAPRSRLASYGGYVPSCCLRLRVCDRTAKRGNHWCRDSRRSASPCGVCACVQDGTPLLCSGGDDGFICAWRWAELEAACAAGATKAAAAAPAPVTKLRSEQTRGHYGAMGPIPEINSLAATASGEIVSGGGDGVCRVWDLVAGQQASALHGHVDLIHSVASRSSHQQVPCSLTHPRVRSAGCATMRALGTLAAVTQGSSTHSRSS